MAAFVYVALLIRFFGRCGTELEVFDRPANRFGNASHRICLRIALLRVACCFYIK